MGGNRLFVRPADSWHQPIVNPDGSVEFKSSFARNKKEVLLLDSSVLFVNLFLVCFITLHSNGGPKLITTFQKGILLGTVGII